MAISRRSFFSGATAAALTPRSLPSIGVPQDPAAEASGLVTGRPVPLPYEELPGFLGKEQLRWHHESHYGGALKGFVALDGAPVGDHRSRVQKMNSVLLHELYFENMKAEEAPPGENVRVALEKRFGSVEKWLEDFRSAAKGAAGWAVLMFHPLNKKLYDVVTDSHDDGPAWMGVPLVVVDTYEHSYYLDYQNKKGDYVDRFCTHIDWGVVGKRLRACLG